MLPLTPQEPSESLIHNPVPVLAVLLAVLGLLFATNAHPRLGKIFRFVPLLVFAYFVPTLLSNTGVIPLDDKYVLYGFVKKWLLPVSLILLTLSVDIPAIMRLGRNAVVLFLGGTLSIVIGGPLALLLCVWTGRLFGYEMIPDHLTDQAWRGLAALSGSWIGGGANFIAIGQEAGTSSSMLSLMVVVDVAVANIWMAVLLWFAGRELKSDARIGADRTSLDAVREKIADYRAEIAKPTDLHSLLLMLAIAFGATSLARWGAETIVEATTQPGAEPFMSALTWTVLMVTAVGLALSFTRLRHLEGKGASAVGSVLLYLLVTTIGAKAEFSKIMDPENTGLVIIGAVWMFFHGALLLLLRRWLKAPVFFMAVGSQANVGGAASAPVVASAFHPALAPVGVLLAVAGYILGTYAGLACMFLLDWANRLL